MHLHLSDFLFAISSALDCVETELVGVTTNHSRRVALLSMRLCQHMGFSREDTYDMGSCALLHDNALTEFTLHQGRATVRRQSDVHIHCVSGEKNASHFPYRGDARNIILHHHENWDGSGYFGMKGTQTNVRAAILRLADHMDLQVGLGSGQRHLTEAARKHAQDHNGTLYSPVVCAAFMEIFDDALLRDLSHEHVASALKGISNANPRPVSLDELERMCKIFGCIIDAKSPHTATHSQGIAEKTRALGNHLGLDPKHVQRLVVAAHLHDVGKLSIPSEILEKPGPLNAEEFKIMQGHALMTETILQNVGGLEEITRWAASHHEKVRGGGYPHGIAGDQLPLESRLLACVDVYQALVENRPYRHGMDHATAMTILRRMGSGGALDEALVESLGAAMQPLSHTLPGAQCTE